MNKKSKKIAQYSALALAASAVLPMACTKDKEADDPNIVHRDINSTITSTVSTPNVVDSIDINLDGIYDVGFAVYSSASGTAAVIGEINNSAFLYCDTTTAFGPTKFIHASGEDFTAPTIYASTKWRTIGAIDVDIPPKVGGISGQGDKFFSFAILIGIKPFHGWLRVNLSSDKKTFVVKDLAYSVLPNTPIKTGAQ
ncbi:MAG: hypothetical protein U0U67_09915 [Chitinophagales bacterium]